MSPRLKSHKQWRGHLFVAAAVMPVHASIHLLHPFGKQKQTQEWRKWCFSQRYTSDLSPLFHSFTAYNKKCFRFSPPSWQCNEQITQRCSRWYTTVQTKGSRFYKVCILWICDSACESLAGLSGVCSLTKLSILWSDCKDVKECYLLKSCLMIIGT